MANSVVRICESCHSVVGRGDGALQQYGRVADLVQIDSPLRIGLTGQVRGMPFQITGRAQLRHAAGGVWDEWYVAFRDGARWGWLAEAQGKYYLTFRKRLPANSSVPPLSELRIEDQLTLPGVGALKVVETGTATAMAAEGELPYQFVPGATYHYADLAGPAGKFATLDGGQDPPTLYLGGEFSLERLGIAATVASREPDERAVATELVSCPQCGGALELVAPDEIERVVCPYCDSMLDAEQGNLRFLRVLSKPRARPLIPLGTSGTLRGRRYTVIGFLQKQIRVEGESYYWNEYLLYTPREPFHWLIHSNNHWTLGQPISAGDVQVAFRTARYQGRTFKAFERSVPSVVAVYGQFYWKVELGERVGATDYISPPYMLSREESLPPLASPGLAAANSGEDEAAASGRIPPVVFPLRAEPARASVGTATPGAQEVNYTLGEYIPVTEVEQAFGRPRLPRPTTVGPNQPYPDPQLFRPGLLLLGAALLVGLLVLLGGSRREVLNQTFQLQPGSNVVFSEPFDLKPLRNIRITCSTPQYNSWMYVDGAFYNERESSVRTFTVAVPPDLAGPGRKRVKYLSGMRSGRYTLRLETRWQNETLAGQQLQVAIHQAVPRLRTFLVLLAILALPLIGSVVFRASFESMRWQDSSFNE